MRLGKALGAAAAAAWLALVTAGPAAAQAKQAPMRPVDVTADNFDQEVKKAKLPVYLLFTMPDCQPCGAQDPISNAVAGEFTGRIKFVRIDVKKAPGFARALRLTTLPTHFMFRDAGEGRVEGLRDAPALRKFIGEFLARPAAPKTQ
jgi:thioredoxin 1